MGDIEAYLGEARRHRSQPIETRGAGPGGSMSLLARIVDSYRRQIAGANAASITTTMM